jgi:hypothetical protein
MKLTLAAWFVPVTLLAAGLIYVRFNLNCRARLASLKESEIDQRVSASTFTPDANKSRRSLRQVELPVKAAGVR